MARVVTLEEYYTLPRPQLSWVIDRLIPSPGMVMLLGEPKVGKSFLALQLALAVAQGTPFAGRKVAQGPVLYLQLDTSEAVWRDRLLKLKYHSVNLSGPCYMIHPDDNMLSMNIALPSHQVYLRSLVEKVHPILIIVDVLREIHSLDEQDSTAMKMVGDTLGTIFHGRALLLVHHTSKIHVDTPIKVINTSRGSSYIAGKMDSIWLIHNNKLHIESRFEPPTTYGMAKLESGFWSL